VQASKLTASGLTVALESCDQPLEQGRIAGHELHRHSGPAYPQYVDADAEVRAERWLDFGTPG
jgi:hypothetical protein